MQVPQRENLLVGLRPHQGRCAGYDVHALGARGGLEHRALGQSRSGTCHNCLKKLGPEVGEARTAGQHQGLGETLLVYLTAIVYLNKWAH